MTKKKKRAYSPKRHYTDVEFGYDDGNIRTVQIGITRTGAPSSLLDASVTLKGDDLDMVTAAFFHLRGYAVSPSLRHYKLKKIGWENCWWVDDGRMSMTAKRDILQVTKFRKGKEWKGHRAASLHFSLSLPHKRPDELRLWIQSTANLSFWLSIMMNKKTADEFGRRLAEAAEWDVDE